MSATPSPNHTEKESQVRHPAMISLLLGVSGLLVISASPALASDQPAGADIVHDASRQIEGNFLIESGVAVRGEVMHAILSGSRPSRLVSDRLTYTFISSREESSRPPDTTVRAALEREYAASAAFAAKGQASIQSITIPSDPNPPQGPGRFNQLSSTLSSCTTVRNGFDSVPADVTYHYVYGYTVDTNNDGKYDAVPGWRLDRVEVTYLKSDVAQLCQ